ncbi:TetR/AcrR family transcriptional regulator [Pseudohongiella sp.]|uniref:HTH tetR-type domain-containing protein n=1 Tax=marine sediment metagenome TaxID=412755 RepID=A0A0F9W7X2_9ZZZZ|nr:TetR/AcrR family transcriptional regulator [Pseudohongiella sp.]HDZ07631.1 TetR/AcrR family transcriptional regulator [Pseudohongiella sp.]HEA63211.1 TetR/AcrR family transcriptional regulator [Pseudohongiella sp.]
MARPVEFVYEDVLTNAMEQFWREGFEASSVQKLLDVTGINRGTLYNSFGDKDTFFKSCLEHYSKLVDKELSASLNNEELAPWDAIEKYFDLAVLSASNKRRTMGCLLVNSFCESINYDKDIQKLVKNYYGNIRKALLKRSKEAEKAGNLSKGVSPELAADVLMNTLSGLRVHSREGKSAKQLAEVVAFTVKTLK